ncbi:MAG: radical SAM protein [Candidatus Riflebacteria bacterium]|nr:radical SAM protein [Candidatus Riflebacteria bacterium]
MIKLKNLTVDELYTSLNTIGVTPTIAAKLQAAAIRSDTWLSGGSGISPRLLERVRENATIPRLTISGKFVSPKDGFARYIFRGEGPEAFEAVRIPLRRRVTVPKFVVCVSSQVGCAIGCSFCYTGRMGFKRQLETWEIIDQVIRVMTDSPYPIGGIVFMGMGEPLLNYESVMRAARILSESCGMAISPKSITISTAGIVPAIKRFIAEKPRINLIVSLSSADPIQRRLLMPIEEMYSVHSLMQTLREYHAVTGNRVNLAWPMISGVNTRPVDATQIADLTHGLPIRLELIDVNDETGRFKPPSEHEMSEFRDALRANGVKPVTRRYSGGQDIHAACGMLAGNFHTIED